jgi:GAF domain-containing protein
MRVPPLSSKEQQRQAAVDASGVLHDGAEERCDRITRTAQRLFCTPIALFSIVDRNRQWFKSRQGLEAPETPRDVSFCGHAILETDLLCVEDAWNDERFADNPLVVDAPFVRFYAGCPIRDAQGMAIGTLCVIDHEPRRFSADEREALKDLAAILEAELQRGGSDQAQSGSADA